VAATHPASFVVPLPREQSASRSLAQLLVGFGAIMLVLWLPTRDQLIFGPIALLAPLVLVLSGRPRAKELGLDWRAFVVSVWILPAAMALSLAGVLTARSIGTFHPLYTPDLRHVGGYLVWTVYQQFLLQDFFMPRLTRVLTSDAAIGVGAVLFAVAHLPNLSLTVATLAWGAVSSLLFRRYRSLYVVGLAQGLLGLCFAVCIPDAMHHHMRVGLGYRLYHGTDASH
jgi:membrane protease YdiL (CAAX protease family)